ncbi:resistance to Congo red protein Ecym_5302 [Eremothecium cymbalariae DBVPG|uniref:Uncharacterized protein n=1 Tax=Eremothecium cymbalariae (strain CBS 270.75 / DBVPG 7215 / KCTC 17166 / NRRL Y-17582) TaxID=931890 RepID=I6NDC2_ERECY|nr:hypothetical protein Ecym_5302 [Eremothecium cymbalariae DBVPG\
MSSCKYFEMSPVKRILWYCSRLPSLLTYGSVGFPEENSIYKARWAIFAVWIVVVFFSIFMINLRRRRRGLRPIIGTAWLTPPSYGQSQRQYNRPTDDPTAIPVPEYTEQPNVNVDLGYYDNQGKFHPATGSVPKPGTAVTTDTSHGYQTSAPIGDYQQLHDVGYVRPQGPPPNAYYPNQYPPPPQQQQAPLPGVTDAGTTYYRHIT